MPEYNRERLACRLVGEWGQEMEAKISETHSTMQQLIEHTQHLAKLDTIAVSINDMKNGLMNSATGRDQIPTKTAHLIFKLLGAVIIGLVVILVFLLTGHEFGIIGTLHQ